MKWIQRIRKWHTIFDFVLRLVFIVRNIYSTTSISNLHGTFNVNWRKVEKLNCVKWISLCHPWFKAEIRIILILIDWASFCLLLCSLEKNKLKILLIDNNSIKYRTNDVLFMIKRINLCGTNQIKLFPTNSTDNKQKKRMILEIVYKNLHKEAKNALHAKRQHKITTIDRVKWIS